MLGTGWARKSRAPSTSQWRGAVARTARTAGNVDCEEVESAVISSSRSRIEHSHAKAKLPRGPMILRRLIADMGPCRTLPDADVRHAPFSTARSGIFETRA